MANGRGIPIRAFISLAITANQLSFEAAEPLNFMGRIISLKSILGSSHSEEFLTLGCSIAVVQNSITVALAVSAFRASAVSGSFYLLEWNTS